MKVEFKNRYERKSLNKESLEFLRTLIPFGILIQDQTLLKSRVRNRNDTGSGILASTILGDLIVRSNWGQLKPCSKDFNNLALLKRDNDRKVKAKEWQGSYYIVYPGWYEFSADMSDHYVFSGLYDEVLKAKNSDEEVTALKRVYTSNNITTYGNIEDIIKNYGLIEFDIFYLS